MGILGWKVASGIHPAHPALHLHPFHPGLWEDRLPAGLRRHPVHRIIIIDDLHHVTSGLSALVEENQTRSQLNCKGGEINRRMGTTGFAPYHLFSSRVLHHGKETTEHLEHGFWLDRRIKEL